MSVLEREAEEVCLYREEKKRNMPNINIRNVLFFCKRSMSRNEEVKRGQTNGTG